MKANDFNTITTILKKANVRYIVTPIEGEGSSVDCPSPFPQNYSTGVTFSFNDDGSLYSVHSYEPDEDEE